MLDKLTDFLLFLGKVLITGSVGKSAFLFLIMYNSNILYVRVLHMKVFFCN